MNPIELTILNYHYVRPLTRSRYPEIKGCSLETFKAQVEHLTDHYTIVSAKDLIGHMTSGDPLPPNSAMLTFDDGFSDHYQYVFPILAHHGVSGCFYPPAAAVLEHRLLDVHKIHFILAASRHPELLADLIDEFIQERGLGDPAEFAVQFRKPSARDSADIIYVKRMLQRGLPDEARAEIATQLFAETVSIDESAFAEELYCTLEQLVLMSSAGMHIGSHGYEHLWLSTLSDERQRLEMERSLDFLSQVSPSESDSRSICYPYGDFNRSTILLADSLGFKFGLADHHGIADLVTNDHFSLPRVSTSDFVIA